MPPAHPAITVAAEHPHLVGISNRLSTILDALHVHVNHLRAMAERALGSTSPAASTSSTVNQAVAEPDGIIHGLHHQLDDIEDVVHDLGGIKGQLLLLV